MSLMKMLKKVVSLALSVFLITMQSSWSFAAIADWSDFKTSLETGDSDSLSSNITYDGTSSVTANKNATIDLGTHTVTGTMSNKNAIQATASDLQFNGGTFTGFNRTTAWGSILHLTGNGNVTFDGTNFINNTSVEAGALSSGTKGSNLTIQNSLFQGNSAEQIGAVGAFTGTVIDNTIFKNNKSTTTDASLGESGGALFLGAVSATDLGNSVNGSTFEGNTSGTSGGAIATRNASLADNSGAKLDIVNTTFTSNTAGTEGGAIDNFFYNDAANSGAVTVASSAFTSNTAADGGAIYNHGEEDKAGNSAAMHLTDSTFTGNHATNLGGAIFNAGTLILSGTNTFSNNIEGFGTDDEHKNDIYNTGMLEINGNATFDGGISGEGQVDIKGTVSFGEDSEIHQDTVIVQEDQVVTNEGTAYFNQLQGDGTFKNQGTLYLNLSDDTDFTIAHLVDDIIPTGQTNINVDGGNTVEINPAEFVQDKVITTGAGHLKLSGDVTAEVENQMTGNSLEIASTITGPFTNIAGANAELVDGAAITGLITNNGTLGVYNTTNYDVQANMTGDSSAITSNIFNIGGTYNSVDYNSNVTVAANNDIENQTINVNNGTLTLFDDGANYGSISNSVLNILADGSVVANASKIGTTHNTIANDGSLAFTGGTNANAVTGNGITNVNKDLTNEGAINQATINVASGAVVTTNASNFNATGFINNDGIVNYTGGTNTSDFSGDGRVDISGYVTNDTGATIDQGTVTNSGVFTNNGDVIAKNFKNTNDITGTGNLTTGNAGDGISSNSGTIAQADLTNNGTFDNSGHITLTEKLTNNANATFNTNADLISATEISNAGNLNITGGTNTNVITGDSTTTPGTVIGTTHFSNTVTNNAAITQGTVTNSGTLTNNALITAAVTNSGTLTSDGAKIAGAIANTGSYEITDGNNANVITGTGTTSILGTTTNTGSITQEKVIIANAGSFTTVADTVTAAIENQGSMTWNGDSVNSNTVTGSGSLIIDGAAIDNVASISQDSITINSGAALASNADYLASLSGIANEGSLEFTGGTNTNAVTGNGSLEISNDVTNQAAIDQNTITISNGTLTTDANLLTTTYGITNNKGLSLTGGQNDNAISGSGTTFIDGTVTNAADIATDIQVNATGNFSTLNDITSTVENRNLVQLVDADVTNTGRIKGSGIINILGDTTNSGKMEGTELNITAGSTLLTGSDDVIALITNDGALTFNDGSANKNVIKGTGALEITGGDITNTAAISQGSISITGGSLTSNADLLASAAGIINDSALTLDGGTNANDITGTGALTTKGEVTNQAAIEQTTLVNDGTLLNGGTIKAAVTNNGDLVSEGDDIEGNITNNGTYAITDGDNTNVITGTGDLQIFGKTANNATISQDNISIDGAATFVAADMDDITTSTGIDNAGIFEMQAGNNTNIITGNTGALKVTGTVTNASGKNIRQDTIDIATLGNFTANAGDLNTVNGITNSGSLTLGEGATANNISGEGTLAVTGAVTNTGHMAQKSFTNMGTFTSDASLLAFAEGITNSNILNVTGGTNANAITGATGTTNFTNDVVNNAAIEQATVTNTGTLTNQAAITAAFTNNGGTVNNEAAITGTIINDSGVINSTATHLAGLVTNDGTLNIAGGEVQDAIDGIGDMNITADLVNAQTIKQATVTNSATMTNSGDITADFTNSGVLDNTADITGAIANIGTGTINSDITYLKGAITNDGTLNANGGTTQDTINGAGEMNVLADLQANHDITQSTVTNDGDLTNNAIITAAITNNSGGKIMGAASGLVGDIVNEGTLAFNTASTGASNISGNGKVEITADTSLTGNNTYVGGTLIDGATLTVAGVSNLSSGDVSFANSGVLTVTAADTLNNILKGQAATDDITIDNATALTLNTSTGAAHDFHEVGAGTMTFAMASNDYTGDTYVDAGTLVGNTQNINNIVNGAAGSTVEFNDTTDADLNEINTLGTFRQSGSAVLNVQNNAFQAAQVELDAGTFAANRAINADILNVNNGATLRGNGNITGTVNVNNGGTIASGNSIDTLTITGDTNFNSGSTTAIEINETPASDKIVITGNANIESGANLTVSNENGRYFEWKEFEIINAGSVSGEFTYDGTIADYDASRIDVEVDYSDLNKVLLTAKRKASDYSATAEGLSRNQGHVAKAMDAVSTGIGGDITNALLQLEKLGGLNPTGVTLINENSTLKSALNDLSGVLYANSALTTLFNAKTAHVYDRISKRNPSAAECSTCHDNVWVEYYNQYDKVYANDNSPRFTNNMAGVLVGYDRSSDEVLLGVYGGAGKSDLRQSRDRMDVEDTSLGIYAGYMQDNWIFKGTLFGGYQNYHGKRSIDFMARSTEGKYHGFNLALDLEGGYNVELYDWLNLKPFVGVLGNYAHTESFTETGADALNLHVESKNQFNTQARLGVQLDGKVGKKFNWYGSAAVKQFIGGDYAKLHMSLGLPGTRMEIISAELGRTYFSGQVGVSYALTNHWSLFGNLEAGVNNKSTNCYGNVGLAYTW